MKRLKTRPKKKTVFIDLDRITGPIPLSSIEPGSVVIIDDVLESIHRSDPRRKWIMDMANTLMCKGRHHKKK